MASVHPARLAAISADLFLISAPRQIANSYCRPAEFSHKLRQASKGAGGPIALWHFQQVQERLTANALQPVVEVDLATDAREREPPGIMCQAFYAEAR
jgi:hypothetical protein